MAITGGSVTFEQSRKLAEYENRKVSITFNVNEPDGQAADEQVYKALEKARSWVLRQLFDVAPETAPTSDTSDKPKRGRPAKAATPPATPAPAPKVADPTAMVEEVTTAPQIRTNPEDRKEPTDLAAVDESLFEGTQAEKPVTDTELLSHITRKNAALVVAIGQEAPVRIRTLIGKYAKSAKDIPTEKRKPFLEELAALAA